MNNNMIGEFSIAVEGIDGSGKRTVAERIMDKFNKEFGDNAEIISFPRHKEEFSGELVDKFLYEGLKFENDKYKPVREGMLYAIDRMVSLSRIRENNESKISELKKGKVLIFDRYLSSNFIHRCNNMNKASEFGNYIATMKFVEYDLLGLPEPNITFVLMVKPEVSYDNIIKRGRETDENESLENLTKAYENLMLLCGSQNYIPIDCCTLNKTTGKYEMKTRDEIFNTVWCYIELNEQFKKYSMKYKSGL